MSIQMNIGDHVSPAGGFVQFPVAKRDMVRWARRRARWIARNKPAADVYFSAIMAGSRSLTALLRPQHLDQLSCHARRPRRHTGGGGICHRACNRASGFPDRPMDRAGNFDT